MNNDEVFGDAVGRIWINGSVVKIDLLTTYAAQDKVMRQRVCRLVVPMSNAATMFGRILAAVRQHDPREGDHDQPETSQPATGLEEQVIFSVPKLAAP
jgi:hypothetical protein